MSSRNWQKIANEVELSHYSRINWLFPDTIDNAITAILEVVFNRVMVDGQADSIIEPRIAYANTNPSSEGLLTKSQISILKKLLKYMVRDDMVARIGLVLWDVDKDYKAAERSIQAYTNIFNRESSCDEVKEVERKHSGLLVFRLMLSLGRKTEAIEFMESAIDMCLLAERESRERETVWTLLYCLIEQNKFKFVKKQKQTRYKEFLTNEAKDWSNGDFAGGLLLLIAQQEKNKNDEKQAYLFLGDIWKMKADSSTRGSMDKSTSLRKAAELYKKAGEKKFSEKFLRESQKILKKSNEWTQFSHEVDLSPLLEEGDERLSTLNIVDKITEISRYTNLTKKQMMEIHEEKKKYGAFYGMFQHETIDEEGVVRSRKKGGRNEETAYQIESGALTVDIISHVVYGLNNRYVREEVNCMTFAEVIRILMPKNVNIIDYMLRQVLSNRTELVVEMLVVTFETFLAALLERNEFPSIKQFENTGAQEDLTMDSLLTKCDEHKLLTKDDIFLVQVLLCDPSGFNLRNLRTHRLAPDKNRFHPVYLFCGYFLIRLFGEYGCKNNIDAAANESV